MEHAYHDVKLEDAATFVEVAELFTIFAYGFFRQSVMGVYVGKAGSEDCFEYRLNLPAGTVDIFKVESLEYIDTPYGRIHFHMRESSKREVLDRVPVHKANRPSWLHILDPIVYCSRMQAVTLSGEGPPGMIALATTEYAFNEEVLRREAEGRFSDMSPGPAPSTGSGNAPVKGQGS